MNHGHGRASLPAGRWTAQAIIDRILEIAGFTEADLTRSLQVRREAMEAELPTRTVTRSDGTVTQYGGGPDWQTRLRATEQLDRMLGLRATGVSEDADVNAAVSAISVHLHVPGNGQAPAAEAKPAAKPRYLRGVAPRAIGGNGHSA